MKHLVLSRRQMQEMDMATIQDGIPSRVLMETAGVRCADLIQQKYPEELSGKVIVLCGTGNNGGDGYVIARHLRPFVTDMVVLQIGEGKLTEDNAANRLLCQKAGIVIDVISQAVDLEKYADGALIIDAIYGIGFRGKTPDLLFCVIQHFGKMTAKVIAIDIASGLDANTGNGSALKADATIAIDALKTGHLLEAGLRTSGKLYVAPIGIPERFKGHIKSFLVDQLTARMPIRLPDAHKGTYGKIHIFGGSEGYTGSVRLCAMAALKSGAGLVYLHTRKELAPLYAALTPEIMLQNLQNPEQTIAWIKAADALVIGCGLGVDDVALEILTLVLKHAECPTVIDADAITLLSQNPELMQYLKKGYFLLTPHKAEFCRIAGITLAELNSDVISALEAFTQKHQAKVLLKGPCTVYMDNSITLYSVAGNDGLATGGSGDALCGIIASFCGQNLTIDQAAISASWLMGTVAERLAKTMNTYSITPSTIIEHLGDIDA